MKKLFAVLLALTLVLSMGTIALAAGNGTITIENAEKDYSYSVYKMLDFKPVDGDSQKGIYTIATGWDNFFKTGVGKDYFSVADNGSVTKTKEPDAELARAAVDYAKTATESFSKTEVAESDTLVFGDLDLGYYAVDTTVGAICSLTNTNSNAKAIEKNELPSLEKKIIEDNAPVDANNARIGENVDYEITVKIGKGLKDYVVTDTMSEGLTYNDDAKLYIDGVEIKTGFEIKNVTEQSFEIVFDNDYVKTIAGKEVVIKFSAELNKNAEVGSDANTNTAKLEYDNENTVVSTPEDTVKTYTTKLTINKFETTDEGEVPLTGAGFTLYKGSKSEANIVGAEITGDISEFVWNGLEEGTYILEETVVPEGYNKAKDITFTLTCDETTGDWSVVSADIIESVEENVELNVFEGKVENVTGTLLPETGGIGTTIFYIVGIVMMLGAGIILISKKRMASFA